MAIRPKSKSDSGTNSLSSLAGTLPDASQRAVFSPTGDGPAFGLGFNCGGACMVQIVMTSTHS